MLLALERRGSPRARRISWSLAVVGLGFSLGLVPGCKGRSSTGELTPPDDAVAWDARYSDVFDDDYTGQAVHLDGRAPNDVRDQRLFAARLGESHVIAEVKVAQVWGQGRYQGRQDQYLEVEIEQLLMGELVKGTSTRQLVLVEGEDPLPGSLQGQSLLLFVRWAPGEEPPYHHHLMPVEADAMAYIAALLEHAKAEGVLDADGVPTGGGKRKTRRKRKTRTAKGEGGA